MNELELQNERSLQIEQVKIQVGQIQQLMQSVMKSDVHYGIIPGCAKPTLLKPGAEKIGFMFRLVPEFKIHRIDLENGHIEYEIECILKNKITGTYEGQGVGSCNSYEEKFRYRWINTDEKPSKEESAKLKLEGKGKFKKYNNTWVWQKKIDNPNIYEVRNTILKIAKKRAFVDSIITATGASDFFTQDIEDFPEVFQTEKEIQQDLRDKATERPAEKTDFEKDLKDEKLKEPPKITAVEMKKVIAEKMSSDDWGVVRDVCKYYQLKTVQVYQLGENAKWQIDAVKAALENMEDKK